MLVRKKGRVKINLGRASWLGRHVFSLSVTFPVFKYYSQTLKVSSLPLSETNSNRGPWGKQETTHISTGFLVAGRKRIRKSGSNSIVSSCILYNLEQVAYLLPSPFSSLQNYVNANDILLKYFYLLPKKKIKTKHVDYMFFSHWCQSRIKIQNRSHR